MLYDVRNLLKRICLLFQCSNRRVRGSECFSWLVFCLLIGCSVSCASWRNRAQGLDTISTCRQLSLRGGELLEQGEVVLAEKALRRAVELNPASAEAHRQLAELLWGNNAKPRALWHIETACRLAREDVTLLVRAGEMRLIEGDLRPAATWARHALGANPKYAEAWVLRGKVLAANGNADQALADFYHALGMVPDSREVLHEIASLQTTQNKPLQSLTTIQRLLDLYAPGRRTTRHFDTGRSNLGRFRTASRCSGIVPTCLFKTTTRCDIASCFGEGRNAQWRP